VSDEVSGPDRSAVVALLSAGAVLYVGLVYAMGVANFAAQLNGAKLSVRETLPLVPLQTLFTRGMAEMIWVTLVLLLFLLCVLVVPMLTRHKATHVPGSGVFFPVFLASFLVISFRSYDPIEGFRWLMLITFAMVFSYFLAVDRAREALIALAIAYSASLGFSLLHVYVYPKPLPLVVLETSTGGEIRGGFITRNGSTWYLTRDREVISIESSRVVRGTIKSREPKEPRTAGEIVRSWLP
jgi:hypothetical protein